MANKTYQELRDLVIEDIKTEEHNLGKAIKYKTNKDSFGIWVVKSSLESHYKVHDVLYECYQELVNDGLPEDKSEELLKLINEYIGLVKKIDITMNGKRKMYGRYK